MQLRQAEALGIEDDHHSGTRHIDPHLDDRCGHQYLRITLGEEAHLLLLLGGFHAPVHHAYTIVGEHFLQDFILVLHIAQRHLVALLHQWEHEVGLAAGLYLCAHRLVEAAQVGVGNVQRAYGLAAGGQLVYD